jgi:hypothetical protein
MPPTPRLVKFSLVLYRLLLAAYPAAFRQEYGGAMAQLFRDTALDGYRRRGLWGLLGVWLRTLGDFTISVIRQHCEQTLAASESTSLRHLAHQWFDVMILTLHYALSLLLRRPLWTCAVAFTMILALWVWSFVSHLGIMELPFDLDLRIHGGVLEFHYYHDSGERQPISLAQYRQEPKYRFQQLSPKPWEMSYSSGHWILRSLRPCEYSRIYIPIPMLFVFVLLFYAGTRRMGFHSERGMS